ncbi:MAG: M48 family metallopeptidase [Acidilobaceae archaeon]|nr:M48 family metallopeptidase [Acidilobaceae archaeon]MCX8166102.1 M48 family metallopeptidase [Acidilobaceae archaeon]MDW7974745.1 M48 family metallopeptidase [Sulfolobales archaeon]
MRLAVFRRSRGRNLRIGVLFTYVEVKVPRRMSLVEAKRRVRKLLPRLVRDLRRARALFLRAMGLPLERRSTEELLTQFSELLSRALAKLKIRGVRVSVSNRLRSAWASAIIKRREVKVSKLAAFLPKELLWYLAVHEACHFYSPSHDKAFWQCVEKVHPTYRQSKELMTLYSIKVKRVCEGLWTRSRS